MRIFSLFKCGSMMRGAQRRFYEVTKYLQELGIHFDVVEDKPSLFSHCHEIFVKTGKRNLPSRLNEVIWSIKAFFLSIKLINRKPPNLILLPSGNFYVFIFGLLLSKLFRIPLLLEIHHIDPHGFFRIKSFLFKKADLFIVVSGSVKKQLIDLGFEKDKIFISTNGIDIEKIKDIEEESFEEKYEVTFLGGIMKYKGIPDLLRSWKTVNKKLPDAKLVIMGQGNFLEEGKKLSRELDISRNVKFTGWVSEEEKYKYLKQSKVLVLPSKAEGFSIVVAEALACGTPVISYDLSSVKEIYGECDAVFFIGRDEKKLARKILELIESEEKRKEVEPKAQEFVKSFSWKETAERDLEIFKKALEKHGD